MDLESFQQARFLSVFGAFVAMRAHQKMVEGRGAPNAGDMARYVEEATEVANAMAEEVGDPRR